MNPDPSIITWALLGPPLQLWVIIASYKAGVPAFVLSRSPVAWVSLLISHLSTCSVLRKHKWQSYQHAPDCDGPTLYPLDS